MTEKGSFQKETYTRVIIVVIHQTPSRGQRHRPYSIILLYHISYLYSTYLIADLSSLPPCKFFWVFLFPSLELSKNDSHISSQVLLSVIFPIIQTISKSFHRLYPPIAANPDISLIKSFDTWSLLIFPHIHLKILISATYDFSWWPKHFIPYNIACLIAAL